MCNSPFAATDALASIQHQDTTCTCMPGSTRDASFIDELGMSEFLNLSEGIQSLDSGEKRFFLTSSIWYFYVSLTMIYDVYHQINLRQILVTLIYVGTGNSITLLQWRYLQRYHDSGLHFLNKGHCIIY